MLISHEYKFIFIKTQKTAGTALEMALRKFMGGLDIVTPLHRKDERECSRLNIIAPQNFRAKWNTYGLSDAFEIIRKRRLKRRFYGLMPACELLAELPNKIWDNYTKISIERNPYDKAIRVPRIIENCWQSNDIKKPP